MSLPETTLHPVKVVWVERIVRVDAACYGVRLVLRDAALLDARRVVFAFSSVRPFLVVGHGGFQLKLGKERECGMSCERPCW